MSAPAAATASVPTRSSFENEPYIGGRPAVDGATYLINGIEWIVRREDMGDRAAVRAAANRHQTNRIVRLSGSPVPKRKVQLLAGMFDGDPLAVKLERAVVEQEDDRRAPPRRPAPR